MAWFKKSYTKLTAPKMKDRIPEGLMEKCESCTAAVLTDELERKLWVCPKCGHHKKITSRQRIGITFDRFDEFDANLSPCDPLKFADTKPYPERLEQSQAKMGMKDGCIIGDATIGDVDLAAAVMEFFFVGGSMGSVVGEKVTRAIERGVECKKPVVVICASGGARMQEGILSLMQMAKTSAAIGRLGEAGQPYITILSNPTTAGVLASFASLGDLIIAEPGAMVGFAGPRVIEQTIKEILPKGFQTAEFVQDKGFIDMVVHRKDLKETLANCLAMLSGRNPRTFAAGDDGSSARIIDSQELA